jgi:hypothetical protein
MLEKLPSHGRLEDKKQQGKGNAVGKKIDQ